MSRGIARERQVKALKQDEGFWAIRAAGSLGDADVVALKALHVPEFIEVKTDVRGPFAHFGPRDREEIKVAAAMAGAVPLLCWWPPRAKPQWIPAEEWPS